MSTKFLHRELKALPRYLRRNGPLPAPQATNAVVLPNPFLPWRNPKTGRWAPPKYSLRQQADLIKKAKATDTVHLLPPCGKLPQPELFAPQPAAKLKSVVKGKAAVSKPSTSLSPPSTSSGRTKVKVHRGAMVTVEWDRKPAEKKIPGAETGTRLYAAKKRMFKGSRLERKRAQRAWRTWSLLHDMRKRIRRYRNVRTTVIPLIHSIYFLFRSTMSTTGPTLSSRHAQRQRNFRSSTFSVTSDENQWNFTFSSPSTLLLGKLFREYNSYFYNTSSPTHVSLIKSPQFP